MWWKNKSVGVLASVVVLLQGCGTAAPKNEIANKLTFRKERLFTIARSEGLNNIQQFYQPPGSENVFFLDPFNSSFHVLNTTNGTLKLAGILPLLSDDFEGVFTVDEQQQVIHVFCVDSLIDYSFRGERLRAQVIPEGNGFIYASNRHFAPVIRNDKLYISYFPRVEGSFRNPVYFNGAVEAEVDLKTNKVRLLAQRYPAIYRAHCYSYTYEPVRIAIDASTHGYLFPHSDSIYLCNIHTGKRSVQFFGVRRAKQFHYLSYDKLPHLNESVFDELIKRNPQYSSFVSAPMAGFYLREFLIPPKGNERSYQQVFAVFDRELNYIGEAETFGWFIDSKQGLLSMQLENNQLFIDKLTW